MLVCSFLFQSPEQYFFEDPLGTGGIERADWFSVEYYDLSGSNLQDLARSLNQRAPRSAGGRIQFARLAWRLEWKWSATSAKTVDLDNSQITYHASLLFPRWIPALEASMATKQFWKRISIAMIGHEIHHRDTVPKHVGILRDRLNSAWQSNPEMTIEQAEKIAQRTLKELRVENEQYDKITDHGLTEGVIPLNPDGTDFL